MSETYYKVLNTDGTTFHGGNGKWFLPIGKRPGKWMPNIEKISPCMSGYHFVKKEHLVRWLGPAIFEVEVRGDVVWDDTKAVTQQARLIRKLKTWNDQTARLFACDCADSVRNLMKDKRSTDATDCARRFAFGLATGEELVAAGTVAWDAAGAVAWDAAEAAAGAAAGAVAWDAAEAAAGAAAWAAAEAAAGAAAWDAAWDAAWAALTQRLFEYLEGKVDLEAMRKAL